MNTKEQDARIDIKKIHRSDLQKYKVDNVIVYFRLNSLDYHFALESQKNYLKTQLRLKIETMNKKWQHLPAWATRGRWRPNAIPLRMRRTESRGGVIFPLLLFSKGGRKSSSRLASLVVSLKNFGIEAFNTRYIIFNGIY